MGRGKVLRDIWEGRKFVHTRNYTVPQSQLIKEVINTSLASLEDLEIYKPTDYLSAIPRIFTN